MAVTTVARNPFARGEYLRESCTGETCANCGQERRVLYRYTWKSDSVFAARHRPHGYWRWSHPFCNLGCYRDFHHLRRNMQPY